MSNPRLPSWPLCDRSLQSILGPDTDARGTPEAVVPMRDLLSSVWKDRLWSGEVFWVW